MANIYVRSGAAGAANGTSWANAYTTLAAALAATPTTADTIWVADDHSESTAATVTLTLLTVPGLKIISANTHTTEPPTGVSTTAVVAISGNNTLNINGTGYIYGIQFQGSTSNNGAADVSVQTGALVAGALVLESCGLNVRSTNSGALIQLGSTINNSTSVPTRNTLINCTLKFGATSQHLALGSGLWDIRGLALDGAGSAPTTLAKPVSTVNTHGIYTFRDSDLTGLAWTNLTDQSINLPFVIEFHRCKLPGGVTIVTGTHAGAGGMIVRGYSCDSADTHNRFFDYSFQGSIVQQTSARIRTGGATQGDGVGHSWLMTGNGNATIAFPLGSPQLTAFNTSVGSPVTATVEILRDNATNLKDGEVWLEVDYYGTSGFPLGAFVSDRVSPIFGTPADQASSSVTWDTTGMSNANKQKLEVTFTPREAGYIRARVMLVPNTSVYVDPYLTIA